MTIESSELFGHHSECHRATGIEESVVLNFYSDHRENLVTVAVNILSVYAIRDGNTFELLEEFELWGAICSICKVRFQGAQRDSILLSFEEAKCAIVEYEPETESLQNVSMHFFQDETLKRGFRKMNALPLARVDPFQRCAAVLVYGAHFAILPLRRAAGGATLRPTQSQATSQNQSSFEMSKKNACRFSSFVVRIKQQSMGNIT